MLEVEYDAQTEREARLRALRDAETLFQQYDVLSVTADAKKPEPDELRLAATDIEEQLLGQMTVDECIAESLPITARYLEDDGA